MVKDVLFGRIEEVLKGAGYSSAGISLEHPEEKLGDFATNAALVLAKREGKKPMEVAEDLSKRLSGDQGIRELIEHIEVAKPGFINFWLKKEVLSDSLRNVLLQKDRFGASAKGKGKRVVVEYSSPNIAKRFGVGHLRSTIIGQALFNLCSFLGYQTISENHLGDWGTQFGMILHQVATKRLNPANLSIDELEELYVAFNRQAAKKPELMKEARAWFKKLEDGDRQARQIWKVVREISLKEFDRIYKLLGVSFKNMHGESFYEDKMSQVIEEAKKKGIAVKDKGAWIIRVAGIKTPLILVKSDGATTYETRDLAAIRWRMEKWRPEKIIYEVGADQALHFQLVFGAAETLGYAKKESLVHVKHGLYRFPTGKMRTRLGQTVKLEEVLGESIGRARKIVESSQTERGLAAKEKEAVARAVGVGAVKYFDLSHHPSSDIVFDWEKMFVLEGNSAPYLQYTQARCLSVLRKAGITDLPAEASAEAGHRPPTTDHPPSLKLRWASKLQINSKFKIQNSKLSQEELALLRLFYRFPEVVEDAAANFSPNLVCSFLFGLAQKFNYFYNKQPILKSEREVRQFRLALTASTAQVLVNGLTLLGIQAPERM